MADEVLTQAALFPDLWPEEAAFFARAKKFLHTGKIAGRNAALVAQVVQWIVEGRSHAEIAGTFHISRNTVAALVDLAERSGKLEQAQKRLATRCFDLAVLASQRFEERLLADQVPANVLPVGIGVLIDKALVLTGQASQIIAAQKVDADLVPSKVNAYLDRLRAVRDSITVESDCRSDAPAAQLPAPQCVLEPPEGLDTGLDTWTTSSGPVDPDTQHFDAQQVDPDPGGGGVAATPGGACDDGFSPRETFTLKEGAETLSG